MTPFNPHSPARAAALLAVASALATPLATTAQATSIYGGGEPLLAPFHRQAADCHGVDTALISSTSTPTLPVLPFGRCAWPYLSPSVDTMEHVALNPLIALGAIYSHDPTRYGDIDHAAPGVQLWSNGVQYALSAFPLLDVDTSIFNDGGTIGGVTIAATPVAGQYPLPGGSYGALVQFPLATFPITLAYDPIYKKVNVAGTVTSYRFNVNPAFARVNGGLRLDQTTYCKVLNGQITNWNDAAFTALNGGLSLKDPSDPLTFNAPMELVGQQDSSGATQVLTRHLAAACAGLTGNPFTALGGTTILPSNLQGPGPGGAPVTGKFTLAGSFDQAAAYTSFTDIPAIGQTLSRGRLAYLGAGYTLPASVSNGMPYTLFTADLKNAAGAYRAPTTANATTAFSNNQPPSITPGAWGLRNNPADWVRVGDLANPIPATAYPIVGTVNFVGYTCYATAARADALRTPVGGATPGYLNYWFNEPRAGDATGVLNTAGFAPLPLVWRTAITDTFLTPGASSLHISGVGPTATNSLCVNLIGA